MWDFVLLIIWKPKGKGISSVRTWKINVHLISRLVNQRLLEVQSQVEELQKSLQDQGSKAEDVSLTYTAMVQWFHNV